MNDELDLTNPDLAEAIFLFINDPEELDDNDRTILGYEDISFAEFVKKYKMKQFRTWYKCWVYDKRLSDDINGAF